QSVGGVPMSSSARRCSSPQPLLTTSMARSSMSTAECWRRCKLRPARIKVKENQSMRAIVIHAPKDLRIDSFPDPAPGPGEVRVKIAAGGICGSDLHYYHHGGFGTVRIQQPMALGHEIAGVIAAVGDGVTSVKAGTRVAVNPSKPCGQCLHCQEGMRNQCLDMRFLGSAMRFPHVQGGFREFLTVDATQAVPIADKL